MTGARPVLTAAIALAIAASACGKYGRPVRPDPPAPAPEAAEPERDDDERTRP
ncbi:MAG: hypothetical protein MJE66_19045 [Proteobacteria bacterium]|nr:hypothetical protein [Pseudomonadota bacterium]